LTPASYWHAANHSVDRAPLTETVTAEFAIVGAGIAGLSLAIYLAEAGRDVVVLEAAEPGAGALGASAGIVAPQLVRSTPADVLQRLGKDTGGGWLRLIAESGGHLFDLISALGIACDARPHGFISPARGRHAHRHMQLAVEQWAPFRSDLAVLDAAEVTELSGTRGYAAAILDRSGGGVDPLRLAHGLAGAAVTRGVRLYHHSAVTSVVRADGGWMLSTDGGSVRARQAVLCANGGNHHLHPLLRESVLPMPIHELTTEPLSPAMQRSTLPHGHSLTDTEHDIFSIRQIEGGRLLTYYPVHGGTSPKALEAAVNARLRAILHYYEPVRIAHLWQGVAWMNSSLLPRVAALDDGLLAIQACNGRGIATNAIAGREVARMLVDSAGYRPVIATERPRGIRGFMLAQHVPTMLLRGGRALGRLRAALS
jgi:glycine/D-amino acid oxidase-like deaminating enzyme